MTVTGSSCGVQIRVTESEEYRVNNTDFTTISTRQLEFYEQLIEVPIVCQPLLQ